MDSVLIASDNSATQLSGVSVANSRVGRGAKSNAGPNQGNWIGDMDELMVFNMILTPSMISSLFRGNTYGLEANCMVWLRFTEFAVGATQVAFDSSGNGNDYSSGSSLSLQTNSAGNVYCFPYCPQGTDSDGYINFPSSGGSFVGTFPSPVVFNTAGFSVEAWVRRVTAGDPTKPAIVIAVGNPADVSNARKYLHIGTRGTNEATRTSGAMTIDYGSDSLDSSTGTILRDNIWVRSRASARDSGVRHRADQHGATHAGHRPSHSALRCLCSSLRVCVSASLRVDQRCPFRWRSSAHHLQGRRAGGAGL